MSEFAPHNMTAPNAPVYFTASASSEFSGSFAAWKAFDGDPATYWIGTGGGVDQVSLDIGSPPGALISGYGVQVNAVPEPTRAPKDWTLEGSNDNSTWTALDPETAQTAWTSGERRNFSASPAGIYYRYFRLNISANNGDPTFTQVAEVYLQGTVAPGGDVLTTGVRRQDAFTASDALVTGLRRQSLFKSSDVKVTGVRRQVMLLSPPVISCNSPPEGVVGTAYSHAFPASGGAPPYSFELILGGLPDGLTLNSSTGVVSGIPTYADNYTFTIQVKDANSSTANAPCSINITGPVGRSAYNLDPQSYTDSDYGQIRPYYVTSPFPDPELAQALGIGGGLKMASYGYGLVSGVGTMMFSIRFNLLSRIWPINQQFTLQADPDQETEWACGQATGRRFWFRFESTPLEGQTGNGFELNNWTVAIKKNARMPVRGSNR